MHKNLQRLKHGLAKVQTNRRAHPLPEEPRILGCVTPRHSFSPTSDATFEYTFHKTKVYGGGPSSVVVVLSASWCSGMNPCNCAKTTGSNPMSLPLVSLGYRGLPSREVYPVLRISGHAYLIYAFLGIDKRWNEFGKLGFRRSGGLDRWLRP
jgi:hypothetical protein